MDKNTAGYITLLTLLLNFCYVTQATESLHPFCHRLGMKKILMVLSSQSTLLETNEPTGVWLSSFTDAYYEFFDTGYEVTLASPKGGHIPFDPTSEKLEYSTASTSRFLGDGVVKLELKNTWKLEEIPVSDYDAVFYADGHGAMFDLAHDAANAALVLAFFEAEKPVAMVGHGAASLIWAAELHPELLKGRRLTCFSNTEEALLKRHHHIPFELKDHLKAMGALYEKGIVPFTSFVVMDGILITGQNPASSQNVAQAVVNELEGQLV